MINKNAQQNIIQKKTNKKTSYCTFPTMPPCPYQIPTNSKKSAFAGSSTSFQWIRSFGNNSSTKPTRAPLLQAMYTRGKPWCRAYSLAFLKNWSSATPKEPRRNTTTHPRVDWVPSGFGTVGIPMNLTFPEKNGAFYKVSRLPCWNNSLSLITPISYKLNINVKAGEPAWCVTSLAMMTTCRPSGYSGVWRHTFQANMPMVLLPSSLLTCWGSAAS